MRRYSVYKEGRPIFGAFSIRFIVCVGNWYIHDVRKKVLNVGQCKRKNSQKAILCQGDELFTK